MREKKQKLADNERDLERRQNESTTRLQQLKKELEVITYVLISLKTVTIQPVSNNVVSTSDTVLMCLNSGQKGRLRPRTHRLGVSEQRND